MKWLRRIDIMGIPGWLYVLLWASVFFAIFCTAITPIAMIFGW